MKRLLSILFTAVLMAGGFILPAQAELARMSPADVDPVTFPFPLWMEDANGTRLAPCTDLAICLEGIALPPFPGDALNPFEAIYFAAIAAAPAATQGALDIQVILAVEGFPDEVTGAPVIDNGVIIDLRDVPVVGDYRVITPWDVDHDNNPATPKVAEIIVTADAVSLRARGGVGTLCEPDPAAVPPIVCPPATLADALAGPVGPFLLASATPGGAPLPFVNTATGRFLFDGGIAEAETPVTGSPTGRNFVRVIGPAGSGVDVTINQFALLGQLPNIHDRRAQLNTKNGKIEVSGTSTLVPPATLTITTEEAVPQALGTTPVRADGSFRFTTRAPRLLPAPGGAVGREVKALRINPGVAGQATVTPLDIR